MYNLNSWSQWTGTCSSIENKVFLWQSCRLPFSHTWFSLSGILKWALAALSQSELHSTLENERQYELCNIKSNSIQPETARETSDFLLLLKLPSQHQMCCIIIALSAIKERLILYVCRSVVINHPVISKTGEVGFDSDLYSFLFFQDTNICIASYAVPYLRVNLNTHLNVAVPMRNCSNHTPILLTADCAHLLRPHQILWQLVLILKIPSHSVNAGSTWKSKLVGSILPCRHCCPIICSLNIVLACRVTMETSRSCWNNDNAYAMTLFTFSRDAVCTAQIVFYLLISYLLHPESLAIKWY